MPEVEGIAQEITQGQAFGLPAERALVPAPSAELAIEARSRSKEHPGYGKVFWGATVIVGFMILLALVAPLLPLSNPSTLGNPNDIGAGPSIHHLLGTDDLGRDLLSRVIWGSRVSLVISVLSILAAMVIGGSLGLLAAYRRGITDTVVSALSYVVLAFPPLLFIMAVEAFWRATPTPGTAPPPITWWKLVVLFTVVGSPLLLRVVRAATLSVADREFVVAARTLGAGTGRILLREILPNVMPAAISFALIGVAVAIFTEGALAFLGLSVSLPTPSLGNIISVGSQSGNVTAHPLIWIWPSLYIFVLIASLNLIGDRIRAGYDVREGNL